MRGMDLHMQHEARNYSPVFLKCKLLNTFKELAPVGYILESGHL